MNNIYEFLNSIVGTIESFIYGYQDADTQNIQINFANSLYDIYYYLSLLVNEKKLNGITLGPFKYPNSFNILINDTNFFIEVNSAKIDNQYNLYTAIMTQDEVVKIPDLGYRDLYKEQLNNETIINDIIYTKDYINYIF